MKKYCGCRICEENEKQGGQRKDRGKIKDNGSGQSSDHSSVYGVN